MQQFDWGIALILMAYGIFWLWPLWVALLFVWLIYTLCKNDLNRAPTKLCRGLHSPTIWKSTVVKNIYNPMQPGITVHYCPICKQTIY